MILVLLAGCAPGELALSEASGSALGGQTLTITGRGLVEDAEVFFGETPAAAVRRLERGVLEVVTPPHLAEVVTVRVVGRRDEEAALEAAYTFLPLEVGFARAADHYLPAAPELSEATLGDLDGDGRPEVVLRTSERALLAWRNTGLGAFEEMEAPPVAGAVGGVALAAVGGEADVLFACHRGGEASRLKVRRDGRWLDAPAPVERGDCRGARAVDLDGDGLPELLELRPDGVRAWAWDGQGLARWPGVQAEDATSCGSLSASGETTACAVSGGVATLVVDPEGEAALTLEVPELPREDAGFTLRVRGSAPLLRVEDADGQRFSWQADAGQSDWSALRSPAVSAWTPDSEGATVDPPLRRLTIVSGPGTLELDVAVLELADGGRALVSDWATFAPELTLASTATEAVALVDDAGAALVVGSADGLTLADLGEGPWRPVAAGRMPALACAVGGLVATDADADGLPELAVACADGQDRLLRGDGEGHWFDDTVGAMPVDDAPGRDLAAADLDLDGLPELIVANPGAVDRLYHGEGAGFRDWTARLALDLGQTVAVLPLDLEDDGDTDLLLVQGDGQPARLFVHTGAGR